jgi:eukaryotic-like serine/threonine-protein kinase
MMLTLGGAVFLQFGKERPPSHYPVTAVLASIALIAAIQTVRLRRRTTTPDTMLVGAVGPLAAVACLAAVARVGILSIVVMPLATLVYFFGAMDLRARAWTVYLVSAFGYLALFVMGLSGWLPALANFRIADMPATRSAVLPFVFAELVLGLTFFHARKSRANTLQAMAALEAARGEIHKREALLDEARLDLARALGAGRVGRFTGYDIEAYAVHEVLGRGGMGEVYLAERRDTHQRVALKVLHEVSSSLDSPHIVRVLETGAAHDGSPYIAMELLEGKDLATILREQGSCSLDEVQKLVGDVCRALSVAHAASIVHRDIKPQNLFLSTTGEWKVLDFGISKMTKLAVTMTHQALIGTPGYMSPEQATGRRVDPRSDIFSLGAVVYRAVTGKPAFSGSSVPAVMNQVLTEMPERPSTVASVTHDIDYVIAVALAKDRDQRFQTAAEFTEALAEAVKAELRHDYRARARAILKERPWRILGQKDRGGFSEPPPA